MNRPGWLKVLRDIVIFGVGVGIVIKQTGFPFLLDPPHSGVSVPALVVGALFCNGPVVLQALAIRFGTGSSGAPSEPSSQPSSLGSSPTRSPTGGE